MKFEPDARKAAASREYLIGRGMHATRFNVVQFAADELPFFKTTLPIDVFRFDALSPRELPAHPNIGLHGHLKNHCSGVCELLGRPEDSPSTTRKRCGQRKTKRIAWANAVYKKTRRNVICRTSLVHAATWKMAGAGKLVPSVRAMLPIRSYADDHRIAMD